MTLSVPAAGRFITSILLLLSLIHNQQASAHVSPGSTEPASVDSSENQASGGSYIPAISGNGRFVAFYSDATDLISDDTNTVQDIYVRDRENGTTVRVSVSSTGTEANGHSHHPAISNDGRFIAFYSEASNLIDGDTNDAYDVFIHDQLTLTTRRVSVASDGSQGNGSSFFPAVSRDGRFVAFISTATNFVMPDANGGAGDVFVHDTQTGDTSIVSVASDGAQANDFCNGPPAITANGESVAFFCRASNLVPDDTNDEDDVFVHNRSTGTTEAISVDHDGQLVGGRDPVISDNGRYVAFLSFSSTLMTTDSNETGDIFLRDRHLDQTIGVSITPSGEAGNGFSGGASISADGKYVAFYSAAEDLVARDRNGTYDVFRYNTRRGRTSQVSLAGTGRPSNGGSQVPSISAAGHLIAFQSDATNLVRSDTNGHSDIFVYTKSCRGHGRTRCRS